MTSLSIFFFFFVSLVSFSYWSKIHINIITGSGVMTIFLYSKSGNQKYPCLSYAQYLKTGQVRNIKFGTNVSNKMSLAAG